MKKIFFLSIAIIVLVFTSCKQNNHNDENGQSHMMNDSTMMDNGHTMMDNDSTMNHNNNKMMNHAGMYSCPMHPKVHGKMNDKCSECGMDLKMNNTKTSEEKK